MDEARKIQLKKEADHYNSVASTSVLHTMTGLQILNSSIGNEVAHTVLLHNMGAENPNLEDDTIALGQTRINLSVLRKIPLDHILMSVGLHLAPVGVFGKRSIQLN